MRVGIGYDIHRFGSDAPLILGGVTFPGEPGLIAHSDGDAVMHAIADAALGAAGLGDIGDYFPDTDPKWEDADSSLILTEALRLAAEKRSLYPVNVDVNVVAERPRLGEKKAIMRGRLAEILSLPAEQVNLKARTAEGLGPVGRGEAVEVQALILMEEGPPENLRTTSGSPGR